MQTHETITQLWEGLRDAIDAAYKTNNGNIGGILRDYARDGSWADDLEKLLQEETANERQHRRDRSAPKGFSARDAAMLLLCRNAAKGSQLKVIPSAVDFLQFRKTAVEAEVLGWLIRDHVKPEWIARTESLDYAKLMQAMQS